MNNKSYKNNIDTLSEYLVKAHQEGLIEETCDEQGNEMIALLDVYGYIQAAIYKADGSWFNSSAGQSKSNRRGYICLPLPGKSRYMCANYTFMVVCTGLLAGPRSFEHERFKLLLEGNIINHLSGDTEDNSSDNLEVVSVKLNNLHAKVMSDAHYYWPDLVGQEIDCQGHKMHRWLNGARVSANKLREWFALAEVSIPDCRDDRLTASSLWDMLNYCGVSVPYKV